MNLIVENKKVQFSGKYLRKFITIFELLLGLDQNSMRLEFGIDDFEVHVKSSVFEAEASQGWSKYVDTTA